MTRRAEFPKSRAEELIRKETGMNGPFAWEILHGDGSDRIFYRIVIQNNSLVVLWSPLDNDQFPHENDSYVYMGKHLYQRGIPVPKIHAYWRSEGLTLMEDLGSLHLQEAVGLAKAESTGLYHQAVELLLQMQAGATEDLDTNYCFDTPVYDPSFIVERELEYFHRSFLVGALGLESDLYDGQKEFSDLALRAGAREGRLFFLHRDFQSRNLMLKGDVLHVIDFQGARLGPPQYDLAALLLDPYVQLSDSFQQELLKAYSSRFSDMCGVEPEGFLEKYPHIALCRTLQVLAAFSFLSRIKARSHFARYIVPAWQQLQTLVAEPPCSQYKGLAQLVQSQSIETITRVAARLEREAQREGLRISGKSETGWKGQKGH